MLGSVPGSERRRVGLVGSFEMAAHGAGEAKALGTEGDIARVVSIVISGFGWWIRGVPAELFDDLPGE
jgi:hypothetical protein